MKTIQLDPKAESSTSLRAGERNMQKFNYWRDRLIILKEAYDEHEPRGLLQHWYDDRRPGRWWAFWIAILIFWFGVIQCIEGAMQVYKAYYPS